ncbi:MAG: right-handed parallel beta-helix repeat-containing protein [Planctomycetota bacterium]|nr:right-handed parallel beta-helix repeat-containing protein [Planctomycetota bacterium]
MLNREKTRQVTCAAIAGGLMLLIGASLACADIINVPDDYPTIQEAIDAAEDGDEIIVAPGTYPEAIDLLGKAVWLHSSDGPDVTTIEATGLGSAAVTCANLEADDTVFEGFTVTGGDPGMFIQYSYPTVMDCVFSDNEGDGMFCLAADPALTDCQFTANSGAGMFNEASSPVLGDCHFSENTASGMHNYSFTNATLTNCTFTANSARHDGGGMRNDVHSSPALTSCVFTANVATSPYPPYAYGGGIANGNDSNPTLTNCTFVGNTSPRGAGMYNHNSSPALVNCNFTSNPATSWGGGHVQL